eukprot:scaffold45999_cov17-Tisochrysis_lutea.AAC.1
MSSDSATNATVSESSSLFGDWRPNLSLYFVCILKNGREGIFGSGCRSCGCNRSMLSFPPGLTRKYMKRISAGTCAWNPSFCHAIVGLICLKFCNSICTQQCQHDISLYKQEV